MDVIKEVEKAWFKSTDGHPMTVFILEMNNLRNLLLLPMDFFQMMGMVNKMYFKTCYTMDPSKTKTLFQSSFVFFILTIQ